MIYILQLNTIVKYIQLYLYALLLVSFCSSTIANTHIDSLQKALNDTSVDTIKVDLFLKMARELKTVNENQFVSYSEKAYTLSDSIMYHRGIAKSAFELGQYYLDKEKYTNCFKYYLRAIDAYEKLGDKHGKALSLSHLGVLYYYLYDLPQSFEYYNQAYDLSCEIKDSNLISINLTNLSVIYYDLKNYRRSLDNLLKAYEFDKSGDNQTYLLRDKIDIGNVYLKLKEYQEGLNWLKESATKMDDKTKAEDRFSIEIGMGEAYFGLQQYDSAYYYLTKGSKANFDDLDPRSIISYYFIFGRYYNATRNFDKAIECYQKGLEINKQKDMVNERIEFLTELSKSYFNKENCKMAYRTLSRARELSDSLNLQEINKSIVLSERKRELDSIQSEFLIEKQNREDELEKMAYRSKTTIRYALVIIHILILLIIIIVINNIKSRKNQASLKKQNTVIEDQKDQLEENIQKLETREQELKELNATKDKFFSIIAHDLKNPFNSLIGFSDLLLVEQGLRESEDTLIEILQIINKTAKQSHNLLENLLTWARSQSGQLKVLPQNIKIGLLFNENFNFLKEMAILKDISLTSEVDENIVVYADTDMVNTIIRNLVSNSIKFTNVGGKVLVKSKIKDKIAEFSVTDNGTGIPASDINKLFSIDNNIQTKGTDKEQGTGLGLILCKEFVQRNNGEIFVESEIGKGSTFTFSLPLANL